MVSKSRILANLGKAVDSATTGHFLAKGTDSNGIFETILYTDLVGTPTTLDSAATTSLIDSAYIQARQSSSGGGGGLDSAAVTTLIDSSYVAARASAAGGSGFVRYEYDTTASQTTFQDSDKTGQVLSYTEDYILVHYNGILMSSTDYTATDGSSVVFSSAVDSGGVVTISKFSAASSGGGGSTSYFGDKALFIGDAANNPSQIDTVDITTTGNASNFGSLGSSLYAMAAMSNGTRAVFAGGDNNVTDIEYVNFATYSSPTTFGTTLATGNSGSMGGVSDGTYGVYPANSNYNGNSLEYITLATTGNGTDFGDMYISGDRRGGASDGTYGLITGGRSGGSNTTVTSTDRITIATPGNATDFGDNTQNRMNIAGMGDGTYAVFTGGLKITQPYVFYNTMDYFTVASAGNATDFGDMQVGRSDPGATCNATRGLIAGGSGSGWNAVNNIDYITIASPGNASDFGDLPTVKNYPAGCSGNAS